MSAAQLGVLALLGVFHGINPGMGWLFAVSIGLQTGSQRRLLRALPAIAAGHELAVGVMVVVLTVTSSLLAAKVVVLAGGALLVGFGLWRLVRQRHLRWVGMRLNARDLALWSFVMSSMHGAGLMLVPVLVFPIDEHVSALDLHAGVAQVALHALLALVVHTGAMIVTCGAVALLVYRALGLTVLRRWWINLDQVWAVALVGAGAVTLLSA
jgi:hypothetical protein